MNARLVGQVGHPTDEPGMVPRLVVLEAAAFSALFFCLMAIEVIIGLGLLAYFAHCFLVVIEGTSAGSDVVTWPREQFLDWAGKVVWLVYMLGISLFPVGLLLRALSLPFLPESPALRFVIGAAAAIWLIFPVNVLSAMTASSRWMPLHPPLLARLLACPLALLVYYASTGLLVGGCTALYCFALDTGKVWLLLPGALVTGAGMLIYARLLGRLAWVVNRVTPTRQKRPRKKPRARRPSAEAHDPWAAPEGKSRPAKKRARERSRGVVEGYEIADEATPQYPHPVTGEPTRRSEDIIPMLPAAADAVAPVPTVPPLPVISDFEEELLRPTKSDPPPPFPFVSGVYAFPFYATTWHAWALLAGGNLLVSFVLYLIIGVRPA